MPKMSPYKRAVAVTGTYTDHSGAEKKRYAQVGTLFQYEDGGIALKIDSLPVGPGWNGFVSFFDIEDKREGQGQQRGGGGGGDYGAASGQRGSGPKQDFARDLDDEIPFATPWSLR